MCHQLNAEQMPLFTGPFCCLLQVTTAFWSLRWTVTASLFALGLNSLCNPCFQSGSMWEPEHQHLSYVTEMWGTVCGTLRADVWLGECPDFCPCWWRGWRGQNHCEQHTSKPILAVNVSVWFIFFLFLFCSQVMYIFRCISCEGMTLQWKLALAFLWSSGFDWISPLRVDRYACYWITDQGWYLYNLIMSLTNSLIAEAERNTVNCTCSHSKRTKNLKQGGCSDHPALGNKLWLSWIECTLSKFSNTTKLCRDAGREWMHPDGPGQAWEVGPCVPCDVQQVQDLRCCTWVRGVLSTDMG